MTAEVTADSTPREPTRVRWIIFALASGMSFVLYLHRYTWGMVKPLVAEEFDWDYATLGALDSCFNLSYAIGQIPFGILGDWFGPGIVLGTTLILWSLAMGSTTVADTVRTMYVARFTFGLMQSGCYSNLNKVTKVWFPRSIRTTVQGFVSSFFGRSGGAVSNILFGTVMLGVLAIPWRSATLLMTVLGLVFAAVFFWLFRSGPQAHPWSNEAEAELITADDPTAAVIGRSALKWSVALRSGNMWFFLFQQFTSAFADNLYPYWIPLFLLVQKGVDVESAGVLASLPLFGGAFGGMAGGYLQTWLIHRTGNRRWVRSGVGAVGKLVAAGIMYLSLGFESATLILCLFALVKFFSDWSQPTVWGTATDIGGRNSASVFSIVNMSGSVAGFVAGPVMGALILYFSQSISVESLDVVGQRRDEQIVFQLPEPALLEGSLSGTLVAGSGPVGGPLDGGAVDGVESVPFTVSASRDFQFDVTESPFNARLCRVSWTKGEFSIPAPPPAADAAQQWHAVVSYQYVKYGNGWAALFIALSLIYFASALSWLFIDCTKPLEDE